MKDEYEPSANLEKTLENVVVCSKKIKKEKKPITFYYLIKINVNFIIISL